MFLSWSGGVDLTEPTTFVIYCGSKSAQWSYLYSLSQSLSLRGLFLASAVATLVIFLKIITVFSNPFPSGSWPEASVSFSCPSLFSPSPSPLPYSRQRSLVVK